MDTCGNYSIDFQLTEIYQIFKVYGPQYSNYGFKHFRLTSFDGYYWKKECPVSKNELVDAGFFNLHKKDFVCCFACGIVIGEWETTDNPWIEHEKHSKNCTYLKLNSNILEKKKNLFTSDANKFIGIWLDSDSDIIQELYATRVPLPIIKHALAKKYETSKMMYVSLDEAMLGLNEALKEYNFYGRNESKITSTHLLCQYCNENQISIVYLPCGHLISCSQCALNFKKCPNCDNDIRAVVKTKFD